MIAIINLGVTGLLSIYAGLRFRRQGNARAAAAGVGFFVVALYLDSIFVLITGSFFTTDGVSARGLGFFVSKSILAAVLAASAGGRFWQEKSSGSGRQRNSGRGAPDRSEEQGWQYMDGLTAAVTLFFGLLIFMSPDLAGGLFQREYGGTGRFGTALFLIFLLLFLLGYYGSLFWHQGREREKRTRQEEEAKRQEADRYLENAEDNYRRMRELWHDLKNHISLLNLLLQEKKYGEMAEYLRAFGEDVDSLSLPEKSGNPIVDALLSDKAAKARREQIGVELSLCDLTALGLAPNEICIILGNLLDNALEANRKVAKGRYLKVECREREECYYIRIQNAADGAAKPQGALFWTDKTDQSNVVGHGLGLRSVERAVHSCGGELLLNSQPTHFTAVVRLPREV